MFKSSPHRLVLADYQALVSRSVVIERDGFGEKVLKTPEGLMVKIFRRKRFLTSALLHPYATRFVRNARHLADRGIPTVSVVDCAYCPAMKRHLVTYRPLSGITVRDDLSRQVSDPALLLPAIARFIATLHHKGVYFRSLHFGNLIVSPETGELGLIDVADMAIRRNPLRVNLRARNFRHLLRYRQDNGYLRTFGFVRFVENYLEAADLAKGDRQHLLEILKKSIDLSLSDKILPEL